MSRWLPKICRANRTSKKIRCRNPTPYYNYISKYFLLQVLEEQVAVVCNIGFHHQLLHEVSCTLHDLLLSLLLIFLGIILAAGTTGLVKNLEEIDTGITLDGTRTKGTLLRTSHGTTQCRLAGTSLPEQIQEQRM